MNGFAFRHREHTASPLPNRRPPESPRRTYFVKAAPKQAGVCRGGPIATAGVE